MGWFNNKISKIAPNYALKREIAQRRFERLKEFKNLSRRNHEAIDSGRMRYGMPSTGLSADAMIKYDTDGLRKHVRHLEYHTGFVSGPIKRIVRNVVGRGIRFQARVTADDKRGEFPKINLMTADSFNTGMEKWFKRWVKIADKRLISTFYELQALAEGALIRDGEVVGILRTSKRPDRRRISPICLELLEADRLQTPMSEINNPKIRNGIEFDEEGVPTLYYILKVHPGEMMATAMNRGDYDQVPAFNDNGTRKVLHLFNPMRPEQSRGFSQWASALKDIQDLDRYREAEIMAALEDACMTGTVTTENPSGFQQAFTQPSDSENYDRIHEFAPNQIKYLNTFEKFDVHRNARPNQQFGEFTKSVEAGPANALDTPPEVMFQNWQGMNYSNARTVLLMFYASCRQRQGYLIDHLCTPIYEVFARDIIARGKVQALGFDRRPDDFLKHAWIPPGWQWVDPVKEAQGKKIEVDNNFETLSDVHASRGEDFEEVMERRAREKKYIAGLEEKYGVSLATEQQKETPAESENNSDDETDRNIRVIK